MDHTGSDGVNPLVKRPGRPPFIPGSPEYPEPG